MSIMLFICALLVFSLGPSVVATASPAQDAQHHATITTPSEEWHHLEGYTYLDRGPWFRVEPVEGQQVEWNMDQNEMDHVMKFDDNVKRVSFARVKRKVLTEEAKWKQRCQKRSGRPRMDNYIVIAPLSKVDVTWKGRLRGYWALPEEFNPGGVLRSPENVKIIEIRELVEDQWSMRFLKLEEKKDKRFFMAQVCYKEKGDRHWALAFSEGSHWLGWKHLKLDGHQ